MKKQRVFYILVSAILTMGCLFPFASCKPQETPTDDSAVIELQLLNNHKNESIDELFMYVKAKIDENYYSESSRALILEILKNGVKDIGGADTIVAIDEVFSNVKAEINAVDTERVIGRIYTLQKAYEKGVFTKQDLEIIATRYNYDYSSSENLSDELQTDLKEAIAWTATFWDVAEGAWIEPEEIELKEFYGEYGTACVISYEYGQYKGESNPYDLEIDGVLFHFKDSRYVKRLVVYVK